LRSTANDLLKLLAAILNYEETPLAPAMASMLRVRRPAGHTTREVALGWEVLKPGNGLELVFKDGATGGYRSFAGFDLSTRTGLVVLSNAAATAGIVDIGFHILNPKIPLASAKSLVPPKQRTVVAVDPKILAGYVGRYSLPNEKTLRITLDGDQLFERVTGELKVPIYPESRVDYFCKLVDEQVTFKVDARGLATGLIYTQSGAAQPGKRMK
jgi:hypothetical protein